MVAATHEDFQELPPIELGYAEECISAVRFTFDSHENVERAYQESYFYRLR